jgi:hypothetical protein
MSIETVEIRAFSGPSVVEINGSDQPAIVEINQGPAGGAGPNEVTTATTTDLTGYIFGDGSFIAGATTATADPDPSTLVMRDSLGEAEFEGLRVNPGGSPDGDFDVGGGVFNVDMQTLSASCSGTFTALDLQATTATVSGTLTANHIHGNLAGAVYAHVRAGEVLAKGDPVYISGSHGTGANLIAIVSKADAGDPLKMPAVGVMDAALAHNASGHMVIVGQVYDFNTAAYPINGELYVAEGGGLTATPPLYRAQPVARVERSNTNNGAIIIKVNGLSAYSNTGNTLVRRSASGDATFSALQFPSEGIGTTELGVNNDGSLESSPSIVLPGASGTLALTDNLSGVVGIAYGGTNAITTSTARTNLGATTTGSAVFTASTEFDANSALGVQRIKSTSSTSSTSSTLANANVNSVSLEANTWYTAELIGLLTNTTSGAVIALSFSQAISYPTSSGQGGGFYLRSNAQLVSGTEVLSSTSLRLYNFATAATNALTRMVVAFKTGSACTMNVQFAHSTTPSGTATLTELSGYIKKL